MILLIRLIVRRIFFPQEFGFTIHPKENNESTNLPITNLPITNKLIHY